MKKKKTHKFFANFFKKQKITPINNRVQTLLTDYPKKKHISEGYDQDKLKETFAFQSIPEVPYTADEYFTELEQNLVPEAVNVATPRFIGHMTSALPNFIPEIARVITKLNQNVVKIETSQSATFSERQALAMLHELLFDHSKDFYEKHIHNIESTLGIVTSGGTIANITALQCARNRAYPTIERYGMQRGARGVVLCSSLGHYSIKKAMGLLGLGTDNLITIPTDAENRIQIEALEAKIEELEKEQIKVIALIGIAGSTECGSIDPLETMSAIAQKHDIHFHVDAAWGGPVKFSEKNGYLLKGIEKADSITIDGHKQLYLPMGIGIILFKDPTTASKIEKQSEYIIRKTSIDLGKRSVEGSRPFNSLYLQAGFKLIGRQNYGALIDKGIENAKMMATFIEEQDDFELLTVPETNIFLYRYIPKAFRNKEILKEDNVYLNDYNKRLQTLQKERGNTFVSYTTLTLQKYEYDSVVGLRVVLANPLVKMKHIKAIIKEQRAIASELEK